ncbi:MAG: hypothetical protein IJU58_00560 [Clostridia bacterium]|nr:hypothetical protein [Clostridia bacterium]
MLRSEYNSPEIDSFVYVSKQICTCTVGKFYDVKVLGIANSLDLEGEII